MKNILTYINITINKMAGERKIHAIDQAHKRSVELRRRIDEKRLKKAWKTTSKEDINKINWTLWRP